MSENSSNSIAAVDGLEKSTGLGVIPIAGGPLSLLSDMIDGEK